MKALERTMYVKASKPFKPGDVIVAAVLVVLVALTVWLALKPDGNTVEVFEDGKLIYELSLAEDKVVEIGKEGHFALKIENGSVFVLYSDCPNQDCLHAQAIKKEGGTIICLPNKIVIKVASRDVAVIT